MVKKKILYVITKSVWGGAQKYVYDLAVNLPKDRFETTVVTGGKGTLVEKLEQAGIRTITLPVLQERGGFFEVVFSLVNVRALFPLIRIFRRERPDVIHLNSSKIGGIGGVAAFIFKLLNFFTFKPVVVFTVHGWPFREARPWWQRGIIFLLGWISTFFHDKIILLNTADFRTAQKFVPQRKLALIFNGIGTIHFLTRRESRKFFAAKTGHPVADTTVLIGTVAELTKNKGLSYLVDAVGQYLKGRNARAVIIGEGEERKTLQNLIDSYGLNRTIFLVGYVHNATQYLKGFDVLVLPSLKEGLPYTIMEAMAASLAIVATNVGGLPDLVTHGKEGLLVPPADPKALSSALAELIGNKPKRTLFGEQAQEKTQKYFRLETMIHKTVELYSHHD